MKLLRRVVSEKKKTKQNKNKKETLHFSTAVMALLVSINFQNFTTLLQNT